MDEDYCEHCGSPLDGHDIECHWFPLMVWQQKLTGDQKDEILEWRRERRQRELLRSRT